MNFCLPWITRSLFVFAFSAAGYAAQLNVFAAASLSDALKEIGHRYEQSSGDTLRFNFGASSLLARQIKEGAPADLFFSADEAKMNDLANLGLLLEGSRRTLLSNALVIVVNARSPAKIASPADLATGAIRRLALGETQTVPAGIYAKAYLQNIGLWDRLSAKVIPTENVRAALAVVENGNAEAGIVYKTDVLLATKVTIAFFIPASDGPKISYPLAVIKDSKNRAAAGRLAAYLASREAWTLFEKYGFSPSD